MRIRISIRGAVQGVGFRPFIYRLAIEMGLTGWVSNSSQGVVIEAEGITEQLQTFIQRIPLELPPLASIHSLEHRFLDAVGFPAFEIRASDAEGQKTAIILPDFATCRDCLAEIFDSANRRYHYPFTNCTNCGPRFSILDTLPYDRSNTTMRGFEMCSACREEFENPLDRRFHAQPNACPQCGPHLEMWEANGAIREVHYDALLNAVQRLKSGQIVAVKGLGGFHLMVDARSPKAIETLRQRKHREEKPLALMAPSVEWVRHACIPTLEEERLLCGPESPIVILRRRGDSLPEQVAPRNPYLGVMLPYTPLHHLLMREMNGPVVATSGNLKDEPICTDEREALEKLKGIADVFLVHNRPIRRHVDDSIARVLQDRPQILRRARGYAPLPIRLKATLPPTLGVGAHLKNTIALAVAGDPKEGTKVFVSQHIGDLETPEALGAFRKIISDLQASFDVRPESVVCDMHPDYLSTQYAASRNPVRVQHHWAHVASCMAENDLEPPVLGVSWDGTGYGTDGTIWGGEFLVADGETFKRAGHFRTFPLPGGQAAARRPRQTAAGLLFEVMGPEAFDRDTPVIVRQMLMRGFRTLRTSSVGRLFDAVASLSGIRQEASFEGQAAMELEFAIHEPDDDSYPYEIRTGKTLVADWEPMIRAILSDIRGGTAPGQIAVRFHNTLVEILVQMALNLGIAKVALTGGCFQNRYLTERAIQRLRASGFQPHWHQRIPPNDGGIAFGQIAAQCWNAASNGERSCVSQFQES
jgi:hydrogenase maturation protein HypF